MKMRVTLTLTFQTFDGTWRTVWDTVSVDLDHDKLLDVFARWIEQMKSNGAHSAQDNPLLTETAYMQYEIRGYLKDAEPETQFPVT